MIVGRKYAVPEAMIFCSCMEVSCFNITKVVYEERLTILIVAYMPNVNGTQGCARVNERWVM